MLTLDIRIIGKGQKYINVPVILGKGESRVNRGGAGWQ